MKKIPLTDIIGQPIKIGDYVYFFSNIYRVVAVGNGRGNGCGDVKIELVDKSKTTKPVTKYSKDMIVVEEEKILLWKLKGG